MTRHGRQFFDTPNQRGSSKPKPNPERSDDPADLIDSLYAKNHGLPLDVYRRILPSGQTTIPDSDEDLRFERDPREDIR